MGYRLNIHPLFLGFSSEPQPQYPIVDIERRQVSRPIGHYITIHSQASTAHRNGEVLHPEHKKVLPTINISQENNVKGHNVLEFCNRQEVVEEQSSLGGKKTRHCRGR